MKKPSNWMGYVAGGLALGLAGVILEQAINGKCYSDLYPSPQCSSTEKAMWMSVKYESVPGQQVHVVCVDQESFVRGEERLYDAETAQLLWKKDNQKMLWAFHQLSAVGEYYKKQGVCGGQEVQETLSVSAWRLRFLNPCNYINRVTWQPDLAPVDDPGPSDNPAYN